MVEFLEGSREGHIYTIEYNTCVGPLQDESPNGSCIQ